MIHGALYPTKIPDGEGARGTGGTDEGLGLHIIPHRATVFVRDAVHAIGAQQTLALRHVNLLIALTILARGAGIIHPPAALAPPHTCCNQSFYPWLRVDRSSEPFIVPTTVRELCRVFALPPLR